MTLDEARDRVGSGVVYRPHDGAAAVDGQIVRVSNRWVFVLYAGDRTPKATSPGQLSLLTPDPAAR